MSKRQQSFDTNFILNIKTDEQRAYEESVKKRKQKEHFLKVGALFLSSSLLLGAIGYGGYQYNAHIDKEVAIASTDIKTNYEKVISHLNKENIATKQKFAENQILMASFAKYKDVIEALNLKNQVVTVDQQNLQAYDKSMEGLKADKAVVMSIGDIYQKKDRGDKYDVIDTDGFKTFQQLKDYEAKKTFKYYGFLTQAENDIKSELTNLETMRDLIVQSVQKTLKDPNFNLEATLASSQKMHQDELQKDLQIQVAELASARQEIAGTDLDNIFPEDKYQEALTAFKNISVVGTDQIQADMAVVRQLVAEGQAKDKAGLSDKKEEAKTEVASNSNASTTPQVIHVHSGPTFLDYYMMHTWMSSSPAYRANTDATINSFSGGQAAKAKSLNAKLSQVNTNAKASYHISNDLSLLSKSMSGSVSSSVQAAKSAIASKPNISQIRASIATAKSSIRTAKMAKSSALSAKSSNSGRAFSGNGNKGFSGGRAGGGFGG